MSIPEYPPLLRNFLAILKESDYREVEPNDYHDNELEGDEFMVVQSMSSDEYEVIFSRGVVYFHSVSGKLVNVA